VQDPPREGLFNQVFTPASRRKNSYYVSLKEAERESIRQKEAIDKNIEIHTRLVNFLNSIIEKGQIDDGENSRFLLNAYNAHPNITLTFENGRVVKNRFGYLVEKTAYVITDLFEFLANQNLRKIKKCPVCNRFFVAKSAREDIKYCSPKCRFYFHRPEKSRQNKYMERYRENKWLAGLRKRFKTEGYTQKEIDQRLEKAKQRKVDGLSRKQVEVFLDEKM
jgi:hypothetical protein